MDNQPDLRKFIPWAVVCFLAAVLIFAFSQFWHYYHTGKIIITTNSSSNTIVLTKTSTGQGKPADKKFTGRGKLSMSVATGQYAVSVSGNSVATVQTAELKPRQTLRYTINPVRTTGVEPVTYKNAASLAASDKQLVYLASPSNWLYKIDDQNNLTNIDNTQAFQAVEWAGPLFGVGQDVNKHLYTITNGTIKPLKVPFYYGAKPLKFDVAPDRTIYISYGSDVYVGSQSGSFKKIYTATSSNPTLAAGQSRVAISDTKYGENASDISKPRLATISTAGKKSKKDVEAEQLTWSPDGQYVAIVNQANPAIYDATLHSVAIVPTSSVVGQFTWLNNTTLLYTMNSQLWTYSLSAKKAQLLANMPYADSITGLYLSDDKSYLYMTTLNPNSGSSSYAIRRIGLNGQQVPSYVYNLQDVLPERAGGCLVGLINFSLPSTVFVQPYPKTPSSSCVQQAQAQLQSQGFNNSQLRFELGKPVYSE